MNVDERHEIQLPRLISITSYVCEICSQQQMNRKKKTRWIHENRGSPIMQNNYSWWLSTTYDWQRFRSHRIWTFVCQKAAPHTTQTNEWMNVLWKCWCLNHVSCLVKCFDEQKHILNKHFPFAVNISMFFYDSRSYFIHIADFLRVSSGFPNNCKQQQQQHAIW